MVSQRWKPVACAMASSMTSGQQFTSSCSQSWLPRQVGWPLKGAPSRINIKPSYCPSEAGCWHECNAYVGHSRSISLCWAAAPGVPCIATGI